VEPEEPRTETNREAELADLLQRLARLLAAPRPCCKHTSDPDRALRLEEAASLLAMSQDFVYRHWKHLGGYKDTDHHIKFRMSDDQIRSVLEPAASAAPGAAGPGGTGMKSRPRALSWAALMQRAFSFDVLSCPHCGGRLRLIAFLHDRAHHPQDPRASGSLPIRAKPWPRPRPAPSHPEQVLAGAADSVVPAPRGIIRADPWP
jgi:hypothetical protein